MIKPFRIELYRYIGGILKNKKCHLYCINGVEDHLHIITQLHPTISLSSLVKDIKIASSIHIKQSGIFPDFLGWQDGYGAFTYSIGAKEKLIDYVNNQEEHHRKITWREGLINLLKEHSIKFDVDLLF